MTLGATWQVMKTTLILTIAKKHSRCVAGLLIAYLQDATALVNAAMFQAIEVEESRPHLKICRL